MEGSPIARYDFTTIWQVDAPLAPIWTAIAEVERWPEWWRGVESVVPLRNPGRGVGSVYRYTWRSKLPYRLTFDMETTAVDPMRRIEGRASGELRGTGRWTFSGAGGRTTVRYDWNVETTRRWMNLLAPVMRPVFVRNHDVVMAWGRAGLVELLARQSA
ncbi:MAG: SRPBCC family protein [Caldilineales bacterium]